MHPAPQSPGQPGSTASHAAAVVAALVLIALPAGWIAWHHLGAPNVWFDESGQYWLAQGLHHFSAPNAPAGGWARLVEYSRVFNSDPGGFTVLLRGWIALFGSSPLALRSLPFAFFVLTPAVIFLAARRIGTNSLAAVLAASAPMGFFMLQHYGTEIRAYSMEACAVTFLFFATCWLRDEHGSGPIAAVGGVAALLLTSRYSAYLFGAAACLVSLLPPRPLRQSVRRLLWFSLPCLVSVAAGYLLFARFQAGGSHRPPAYVEAFLLQGKGASEMLAQLRTNLLSREALPTTIYVVVAPLFACFGPRALADLRAVVGRTAVFCALAILFTAAASQAGKLPWGVQTRWSIGHQALSACCVAMAVIAAGHFLESWTRTKLAKSLALAAAGAFAWVWGSEINRALHGTRPYYETTASHLQALARAPGARELRFFVQSGASPTVRYLCEAGPLRGAFDYPRRFHIETGAEASGSAPIPAQDHDVIILNHISTAESYRRRVTGGSSELVTDPQPSCLLLLKQ